MGWIRLDRLVGPFHIILNIDCHCFGSVKNLLIVSPLVSEIAASSLYVEAEMADFDITPMEIRHQNQRQNTANNQRQFCANFILFNILSSLSYLEMESQVGL